MRCETVAGFCESAQHEHAHGPGQSKLSQERVLTTSRTAHKRAYGFPAQSQETILECLAMLAERKSLAAGRRVKGVEDDTLLE